MEPETEQTNLTDGGYGRPEDSNSGDSDLNSLLAEYEEGTKPQVEPKPETRVEQTVVKPDLSSLDPVIQYARDQMQKDQQKAFDTDVESAVERMADQEAFKGLPKTLVEDAIISHAFKNKAFDKAFQERAVDPTAWDNAQRAAAESLAERMKDLPRLEDTPDDRDDIAAAKATVEGVQDGQTDIDDGPSIVERWNMSDTDWRRYQDEKLAR
jgi:hypothetical protein